jgi:hypothetical protein
MRTTILAACVISTATLLCLNGATAADEGKGQTQTVQNLYEMCKSHNAADTMFCLGYVGGIHDMMVINNQSADEKLKGFRMCDDGSTRGASVQAFKNWAEKYPQYWSQHMFTGVVVALSTTWPCK